MNDIEKLQEISRLLDEAYKHYFSYEGHCKSYEGHISISYGNYWDRQGNPTSLPVTGIHISSYVFGGIDRGQDFDTIDEALEAVREWHAREMEYDPNTPEAIENREIMDQIAGEFIASMMEQGRLTVIEIGEDGEQKEKE